MYSGESSALSITRGHTEPIQYLAILLVLACYYVLFIRSPTSKNHFLVKLCNRLAVFPTCVLCNAFLCWKFKLCLASVLTRCFAASGALISFLQAAGTVVIPAAYCLSLQNAMKFLPLFGDCPRGIAWELLFLCSFSNCLQAWARVRTGHQAATSEFSTSLTYVLFTIFLNTGLLWWIHLLLNADFCFHLF